VEAGRGDRQATYAYSMLDERSIGRSMDGACDDAQDDSVETCETVSLLSCRVPGRKNNVQMSARGPFRSVYPDCHDTDRGVEG
jgi:hypothetical protein